MGSVAISAHDLPAYISLLLKLAFCNLTCAIYGKNNIAKMCLVFFKFKIVDLIEFFCFFCNKFLCVESQKPLGGFSQNLQRRYIKDSRCAEQIYAQIGLSNCNL